MSNVCVCIQMLVSLRVWLSMYDGKKGPLSRPSGLHLLAGLRAGNGLRTNYQTASLVSWFGVLRGYSLAFEVSWFSTFEPEKTVSFESSKDFFEGPRLSLHIGISWQANHFLPTLWKMSNGLS